MSDGMVEKAPAVKERITGARKVIGDLEDGMLELKNRLKFVSLPEEPQPEEGGKEPLPRMSELELDLLNIEGRLLEVVSGLRRVLDRLQI